MEKRSDEARHSWSMLKWVFCAAIVFRVAAILVFAVLDFMLPGAAPGHYEVFRMIGLFGGLLVEVIVFLCIA